MNVLPVCSAEFLRTICPHSQLFAEEYKRCIPHCCPCHVKQSYCGSPLEVSVSLDLAQQDAVAQFDAANVLVFARFEVANEAKLPSEIYSLNVLQNTARDDSSVEAPWFEGVRQTTDQHQETHLTFLLNGEPYDKWYYHWESSPHKTQRATKHVLRAYVLYRLPSGCQDTRSGDQRCQLADDKLDLLCFVDSPSFTLVSYRRSSTKRSIESNGTLSVQTTVSDNATFREPYLEARPVNSELEQQIQDYDSRKNSEQQTIHHFEAISCTETTPPMLQAQHDYARYRQFQEHEGLEFWLWTPEDAALSEPLMRSQMQCQEERLVLHKKRHRQDYAVYEVNKPSSGENKVISDFMTEWPS
ncbi:hypothetical protein GN958_ATG03863 [Phytophthora infestans]|uniref:Uncharacterized protein n=1 Tax=Phytophthora infestans TaxID=4787 RepID=A0A8S9V0L2_PHYIN|nr:hypothetical protein GN958_ATG03863 [Phytophthora infestans]